MQDIIDLAALAERVAGRSGAVECSGLAGAERAYLIAGLQARQGAPVLVLCPSNEEAGRIFEDLQFFCDPRRTPLMLFPTYHIQPFKFLTYHNQTAAERLRVLYQLMMNDRPSVVVTSVQALLQRLLPKEELNRYAELILEGEEIDRERLIGKLICGGYMRTALVEEPGDFSVRGGLVDIFSPLYPDPLRLELFGDRVESLRFFSIGDQRRIQTASEAVLLPAREAILNPAALPEIMNRIRLLAAELNVPVTQVRKITTHLTNQEGFPGIESLLPLVYPRLDTFNAYLPFDTICFVCEPAQVEAAARDSEQQARENYDLSRANQKLCVPPEALYRPWADVRDDLARRRPVALQMLAVERAAAPAGEAPAVSAVFTVQSNSRLGAELRDVRNREEPVAPLAQWIWEQRRLGFRVCIACQTRSRLQRLTSLLSPYGLQFSVAEGFADESIRPGEAVAALGRLSAGFVWPALGLAVVSEDEIFGIKHLRRAKAASRARAQLLDLQELKAGDLIVHAEHGIGQYGGLQKLAVEGVRGDFLALIYQGGDRLYLPVDRMGMVHKYMGVEGHAPALDKLGGKSWARVKARVKRSAEKMAGELLRLYAQRKVANGFAFGTADSSFREFESGFQYEETPDQQKVIDDVLEDMHLSGPMDRLVCGDVGYGKTEVALRASFLAVNNGKQVAVLVPTTILAEQHFGTFRGRFQRYPVNIACLTRFRSRKEQQAILAGLRSGAIDIVIGTHRLIQKDVAFKDLGLLVLDEEHRFGVRHKEKLKALRASVDVLALTATPIPRTLHMSLTGIRDISLIRTPPEYRRAIVTFICEFDRDVIAEAIRRELQRQGQVYFVHNHIGSIHKIAALLKQLVPEARLDVAHGRMDEEDLERVMYRFFNRDIDLLVCTTIIESGLDIPTANTIIVNRADCFGLAQMYQLRGRVGRSDEQAYAYLLIPDESLLAGEARKRLKVLMEHSDLGAGFNIAMNDLEIRGGGTILGVSQSGHIAAVGYDMFLKLMEEAVSELKGDPVAPPLDPEINIQLSAFFSESYIPDIDQRMMLYRRLARMTELQEIADIRAELTDRYGKPPEEGANLLFKIMLKVLAREAGVSRLDVTNQRMTLRFSEDHCKHPSTIVDMVHAESDRFELSPDGLVKVRLSHPTPVGQLAQAKNILQAMGHHVNSQEY